MINIHNKRWDELNIEDIRAWLNDLSNADGQEGFFFEFKSDDVDNKSIIKEVTAFSNTYGGYILIGVDDNSRITGCRNWTEERIFTTIYDTITPLPIFDVKTYISDTTDPVIIVKVEPGTMPPYITNQGKIIERVSSGSIPIKDSTKLEQLYKRNRDNLITIGRMIELPEIIFDEVPNNVFGYIDLGFYIELTNMKDIRKRWLNLSNSSIVDLLKATGNEYSISEVGDTYCITVGKTEARDNYGTSIPLKAGANNFIEISNRGNVRCRIMLRSHPGEDRINLAQIVAIQNIYSDIYKSLLGVGITKNCIYARKYEKLTVLKQFVPMYEYESGSKMGMVFNNYLDEHRSKYNNSIIVEGNRIPADGYTLIDKKYFDALGWSYSDDKLVEVLFDSRYFNLGFIDPPQDMKAQIDERLKTEL